jgi:hypothetical protein
MENIIDSIELYLQVLYQSYDSDIFNSMSEFESEDKLRLRKIQFE